VHCGGVIATMMAHEEEPLRPVTVSELIDTQRKRQIAKLRLSGKESGLMTIALMFSTLD